MPKIILTEDQLKRVVERIADEKLYETDTDEDVNENEEENVDESALSDPEF